MTDPYAWIASLPQRQRRAIRDHLRWLDGRMPSEILRESRCDFTAAPIVALPIVPQRKAWQKKRKGP